MSAENMMPSSSRASVKSTEYQWPSSDQLYNYRNPQSLNLFTSSPVIMSVAHWKGNRDRGLWTPLLEREAQQKYHHVCPLELLLVDTQLCLVSKFEWSLTQAGSAEKPKVDMKGCFNVMCNWKKFWSSMHLSLCLSYTKSHYRFFSIS